jgi:N-acyl-D-amino-acid deacylase
MLAQGITSVLTGHCGSSLAPLLKGSLASIQKWTNVSGVNVNWRSMGEFLEVLERRGVGANFATLVGLSTLRRDFTGDESRPLTKKESLQLQLLLKRSLDEGGWGLSLGLGYAHGRASQEEELGPLLSLLARRGAVASFHLRDEREELYPSLHEVISLVRNSKVRAKISHFKIPRTAGEGTAEEALSVLDSARQEGVSIFIDCYPYTTSASVLYVLLPEWATEGGRTELLAKLQKKALRQKIVDELSGAGYEYERIRVAQGALDRTFIGKTVAELAHNQDARPEEVLLRLLEISADQVVAFTENIHEDGLRRLLSWPFTMLATDGSGMGAEDRLSKLLAHPRNFGSTARILETYVRKEKILTFEEAVRKLTSLPARFLGLSERGVIREGMRADITLFDKDAVRERSTFENPFLAPEGIPFVLVNGAICVRDGNVRTENAGIVLRKRS